ncbi:VWA domain-containing protein [Shewanella sp. SW36]|uniref:VWA domain-containing protein n=1 Tax=Shewanella TaxID=22 RepID=UPI0021D92B51|nr:MULTISPECIES: VWA domain-containing protein [unclassified Shewanella]MCU7973756.1 VWA domain-containing protein [Shewanella sp. SW36]MCU7989365.1 VWA domain-containing protein [Shewanella sp. SW1]MCU8016314.1 VWA domain-containing protein [Shewanella sp. SM72]MCU8051040.1 VWA domain-containing protein [Shewanella sp. SM43]
MSLHFIRPEWLLALVPLALALLSLWRQHESHSAWNRYIAPHLAKILVTQGNKKSRRPLHLLALTWLIATLALAGPAVNKQSLPVFAAEQGRVLVMDMSVSMFATDLAPNRLTQAKFRATDLLRNLKEGETGLVAFAGDAFTISPLTRDTGTLLNLLPTLSPEIMPVRGSNLAAGLTQAKTLLAQGGHIRGDIILMTDGITAAQFDEANSALSGTQYRLAVVAFGTSQGAPIRLPDGQLQRDSSNEVVVASTDFALLQKLAVNNKGVLIQNRTDGNDLAQLQQWLSDAGDAKATDLDGETWQDLGPYLALLLLLPALFSFRQGIVASVGFVTLAGSLLIAAAPQPAHASMWDNAWDNVWKTTDQQAMQAYQSQDYANAAKQFESPQWRGSAQYKAGDFAQALKTFEQDSSAQGLYNQGNALMQLGKPDKAKERYQAALEKQADFPAAKANLELAEKLLQEQQQQQGKNEQQDKNQDQQGDQQSGDQQSGDQKSQDKQQSDQDSAQKDKQDQAGQEPQDQQDDADADPSPEQQKTDEQQSEQDKQNGNAQDQQDEAKQQNGEQDAQENEPADNEAKMQAQAKADAEEQKSTEQEKQSVAAKEAPEQNAQDKQEAAMSESVEAPPTNSEPLPAEMQRALRGVSEDPQVLLRNKMQLEYQKRRQNGQISKDNEQW